MSSEVTEAELAEALRDGRILNCADHGTRRPVAAGLIRRCIHDLSDQADPHGVRLVDADIVGCLDLAAMEVPFPLRFEGCQFDAAPVLDGAVLQEMALTGCLRLPGLLANGLRVRRDLDLSRSVLAGAHATSASTARRAAIWLCESDIGGRLLCFDTVIDAGDERSIQADRMHVGGTMRLLHNFEAKGEMRLLGVRIDGSLDLTGARIQSSNGLALDLSDAVIGGNLYLIEDATGRRPVFRGSIEMGSAHISGRLLIRNATLDGRTTNLSIGGYSRPRLGGIAVNAPRLSVGAEVTLEGPCEVTGRLNFPMSDLSSFSVTGGSSLNSPGQDALDLTDAVIRSGLTVDPGTVIQGTMRLRGAHIHGNLRLQGAVLSAPGNRSLIYAHRLTVDGDVELQNLEAVGGQLGFRSATLGSVVDAAGARLINPDGTTLNLHQAVVRGSVRLAEGFESVGLVQLNRLSVDGLLRCTGGSFRCPAPSPSNRHGHAIEAISATVRSGMDLGWTDASPSVDFTNASTTFLADNPANWPPRFSISGFAYDRFERPHGDTPGKTWDHVARSAWLTHQDVYDSGPYEQAARVFRQHGHSSQAEEILIAQRRQARRMTAGRPYPVRRAVDAIYGACVGYGYRPGRIIWLLAGLLILVATSLEIPAGQATMRAASQTGTVYTTSGPQHRVGPGNTIPVQPARSASTNSCGDGAVRCFSPILYAVDTVVPLVSLDQRSTWYPNSHVRWGSFMQWWLNIATLLGWLLSSILALSLAKLSRNI